VPPILFFILSLLLFGGIHAFYMYYHKRIFGDYTGLKKSRDRNASLIFSMAFSVSLFFTPLFLIDDLYLWVQGHEWPEELIPRWFFSMSYTLQYVGIATFLGLREYQKRLRK